MGIIEQSKTSLADCRVCRVRIRKGELRFGRMEDDGFNERMRWRHVACAATKLKKEVQAALDAGGWELVPMGERDDLRALLSPKPKAKPKKKAKAKTTSKRRASPKKAKQGSPANDAVEVFADWLTDQGDPRGTLLASEIALSRDTSDTEARAINRAATELFLKHEVEWRGPAKESEYLRLCWRGGFIVGARVMGAGRLASLFKAPGAQALRHLEIRNCRQEDLDKLLKVASESQLDTLDLSGCRIDKASVLQGLEHLRALRMEKNVQAKELAQLTQLKALELELRLNKRSASILKGLPEQLEELTLVAPEPASLHELLRLPGLRALKLTDVDLAQASTLAQLPALETLIVDACTNGAPADWSGLKLKSLALSPASPTAFKQLAKLSSLERLALVGPHVGSLSHLEPLQKLRHLTLVTTSPHAFDLSPLAELPNLRSLRLRMRAGFRQLSGWSELTQVEHLGLDGVWGVNFEALSRCAQLRSLCLHRDEDVKPIQDWSGLEGIGLRALRVPQEQLKQLMKTPAVLAGVRSLETWWVEGAVPAALQQVPSLRQLKISAFNPKQLDKLRSMVPQVALLPSTVRTDLFEDPDRFAYTAAGWPKRTS